MHSFHVIGITFIAVLMAAQVSEAKPTVLKPGLLNEMPVECKNMTFCYYPHASYPYHIINELLNKTIRLQLKDEKDMRHRQGIFNEDNKGCAKTRSNGPVHEIVDTKGNVRVVVQNKDIFQQWISVEQCLNGTRRITNKTDPSNIKPSKEGNLNRSAEPEYIFEQVHLSENHIYCAQKALDYKFLVLTEDGTDVEFVATKNGIPMGCIYELRNYE